MDFSIIRNIYYHGRIHLLKVSKIWKKIHMLERVDRNERTVFWRLSQMMKRMWESVAVSFQEVDTSWKGRTKWIVKYGMHSALWKDRQCIRYWHFNQCRSSHVLFKIISRSQCLTHLLIITRMLFFKISQTCQQNIKIWRIIIKIPTHNVNYRYWYTYLLLAKCKYKMIKAISQSFGVTALHNRQTFISDYPFPRSNRGIELY